VMDRQRPCMVQQHRCSLRPRPESNRAEDHRGRPVQVRRRARS
jgi:hypothetical protein